LWGGDRSWDSCSWQRAPSWPGCGGGDSGKTLDIADIGRTENTAISGLTKVLLEELGYEQVSVKTSDLDSVFESVADGDLDAFQDVWLPN
jgi:glycine betaine/proline transport system substrate-binding protein